MTELDRAFVTIQLCRGQGKDDQAVVACRPAMPVISRIDRGDRRASGHGARPIWIFVDQRSEVALVEHARRLLDEVGELGITEQR